MKIWLPFVPIPYECNVGTLELREVHSPHSMEEDMSGVVVGHGCW